MPERLREPETAPAGRPDAGPEVLLVKLPRGDAAEMRVTLSEYKGHKYIGLRVWNKGGDATWRPDSKKGCSVKIRELPEFLRALQAAAALEGVQFNGGEA